MCRFRHPLRSSSTLLALLLGGFAALAGQDVSLLRPSMVFDGASGTLHEGWVVRVEGNRIAAVGPASDITAPATANVIELPGLTLLPGLIEGHAHLLLHPYDETPWIDQVLFESLAERTARAVVHAENSLMAGITTLRDLGTEGAGYADVGLKDAIEKGVIPGPRLIVVTRAIVATGSYQPKGAPEWHFPKGAEEADGYDDLIRVARDQIGRGADWVKVYADYRWGADGTAQPTFTEEELRTVVEVAGSSGRWVSAHATTPEAMRRSVEAGIHTIEHGDGGTRDVFRLMADRDVALCPTLAAGEAYAMYAGWRKGVDPDPQRVVTKKRELPDGPGGGGPHVLRRRRRGLLPRRQRVGAGAHGGVRHADPGRPDGGHVGEREDPRSR